MMIMAINKRIRNNKGFTLIELIVVLAVLGILAAIAVPRFIGTATGAKEKADAATATNIAKAAELAYYEYVDMGTKSTSDIDLTFLVGKHYLDETPEPQSKNGDFVVKIKNSGKIAVGIDTNNNGNIDDILYGN